jgi:hypothetical protein
MCSHFPNITTNSLWPPHGRGQLLPGITSSASFLRTIDGAETIRKHRASLTTAARHLVVFGVIGIEKLLFLVDEICEEGSDTALWQRRVIAMQGLPAASAVVDA